MNNTTLKKIIFSTLGLLAVNAVAQTKIVPIGPDARKISPVEVGRIDKVEVIKNTDGTSATKFDVMFNIYGCTQRFENFAYTAKANSDHTVTVNYAAFISLPVQAPDVDCAVIMEHPEMVIITGVYDESEIKLVMTKALSYDTAGTSLIIPESTAKIEALDNIKVTKVDDLCPPTAICAKGGTRVKLVAITPGCVDSVGAYTYVAEQVGKDIQIKFYALIYRDNRKVLCVAPNFVQFELKLINQYAASVSDVKVELFKK